jgi:hypothetical protein
MNAYDVALVPVIMGLVQVAKQVGMPSRFASLLSVILGAVAGIFYLFPGDLLRGIFVGLTFGLAACGLYSGGKNTAQNIQARRQTKNQAGPIAKKNNNGQL